MGVVGGGVCATWWSKGGSIYNIKKGYCGWLAILKFERYPVTTVVSEGYLLETDRGIYNI